MPKKDMVLEICKLQSDYVDVAPDRDTRRLIYDRAYTKCRRNWKRRTGKYPTKEELKSDEFRIELEKLILDELIEWNELEQRKLVKSDEEKPKKLHPDRIKQLRARGINIDEHPPIIFWDDKPRKSSYERLKDNERGINRELNEIFNKQFCRVCGCRPCICGRGDYD